jgi:hypothetical protein
MSAPNFTALTALCDVPACERGRRETRKHDEILIIVSEMKPKKKTKKNNGMVTNNVGKRTPDHASTNTAWKPSRQAIRSAMNLPVTEYLNRAHNFRSINFPRSHVKASTPLCSVHIHGSRERAHRATGLGEGTSFVDPSIWCHILCLFSCKSGYHAISCSHASTAVRRGDPSA